MGDRDSFDAMLESMDEASSYRRIELITGRQRRRRWTAEEKAGIVADSMAVGANISEVARRHEARGPNYNAGVGNGKSKKASPRNGKGLHK